MSRLARLSVGSTIFLWLLTVLILLLSFAMPNWRVQHATARAPNYQSESGNADMVFVSGVTTFENKITAYFIIEPLDGTLTVPGGNVALEPGEVLVSPSLLPSRDLVSAQFGEIVGVLSPDILLNEHEAVIYSRPADGEQFLATADFQQVAEYAKGFGPDGTFKNGEVSYDTWAGLLPPLIVVALVPPLIVFTVITGTYSRGMLSRSSRVLQIIGASRRHLWLHSVRELGISFLAGTVFGLACQTAFLFWDVSLPIAQFTTVAQSLHPYIPAIIGIDLVVLLVLGYYFGRPVLGLSRTRHLKIVHKPRGTIGLYSFVGGVALTLCGSWFSQRLSSTSYLYILVAGCTLLACSFSPTLAFVVEKIMSRLSRKSRFRTLDELQYQWAAQNSKMASRSGGIAGVMLIIGVFISSLYVVSNDSPWGKNYDALKGRVAQVTVNCQLKQECFDTLFSELKSAAPDSFIGTTFFDEANTGASVHARIETGRETLDSELSAIIDSYVPLDVPSGAPPAAPDFVIFYVADQDGVDLRSLSSVKIESVSNPPMAMWIGAEDHAAAAIYNHHSRWVFIVFGLTTALCLGASMSARALETLRFTREVAGIVAVTGTLQTLVRSVARQKLLVTVISTALGLVLGLHISSSFARVAPYELPVGFVGALILMLMFVTLAEFWLTVVSMKRASERWLPGKFDVSW